MFMIVAVPVSKYEGDGDSDASESDPLKNRHGLTQINRGDEHSEKRRTGEYQLTTNGSHVLSRRDVQNDAQSV